MDSTILPEVVNPTPQSQTTPPEHVIVLDANGDSISRSSSAARINDPARSNLTELTGDDIFRMKGLRQSDSVSASEVAEQSVSVFDGNTEEDNTFVHDYKEKSSFDPEATQHDGSELNEEDIFRMKALSISRTNALSEQAGQSALSQVDSASNFEEHVNQVNF